MKLNCKAGDLAIKVKSYNGSWLPNAIIVKVVSFAGNNSAILKDGTQSPVGPRWVIEYNGSTVNPETGRTMTALDSQLRPIRDNDGEDETLQWAPVTTKETTWTT